MKQLPHPISRISQPKPRPAARQSVTQRRAWSPDGELLLVAGVDDTGPRSWTCAFVDATGSGAAVPGPIRFQQDDLVLLGWRSSRTMLVGLDDGTARGPNLVAEVPLDGSPRRIVSRLSVDAGGLVHGLQLASGLLADADIRDTGPPAARTVAPVVAGNRRRRRCGGVAGSCGRVADASHPGRSGGGQAVVILISEVTTVVPGRASPTMVLVTVPVPGMIPRSWTR
jgi:hypothetical protein